MTRTYTLEQIITAVLAGKADETITAMAYAMGPHAVSTVLLAASKRLAQLQGGAPAGPHTPSSAVPPHAKGNTGREHPRKPGAKKGHKGTRRDTPSVDHKEEAPPLKVCPCCANAVSPVSRRRTRIIEDIAEGTKTQTVEHSIGQQWCSTCKKHVEPTVSSALPRATFGHRLAAFTGYLHYGMGLSTSQVTDIMDFHLRNTLTPGGLIDLWKRYGDIMLTWYADISRAALHSAVLNADETGWRVGGTSHWLWCFAGTDVCCYRIEKSRGVEALLKFFVEPFRGVLVRDFYRVYEHVAMIDKAEHQVCIAHLLRELKSVGEKNHSEEFVGFSRKLRRLLYDGLRLRSREDFTPEKYQSRIRCIDTRLIEMFERSWHDPDAIRLAKRLMRHANDLFTFLSRPEVSATNNHAERNIRPAVIMRKNIQGNRSTQGADTQAIWMSIIRTLKLRGIDPVSAIVDAARAYVQTGILPPLPLPAVAIG